MDLPNREIATAEAAALALAPLMQVLKGHSAPHLKIATALRPLFGIRWSRPVIKKVGSGHLCKILSALRNSNLSKLDYDRLSTLWTTALSWDDSFPPAWDCWRSLIERWDLDTKYQLSDFVPAIHSFVLRTWVSPFILSSVPQSAIYTTFLEGNKASPALDLWKAAVLAHTKPSSTQALTLSGAQENADTLIELLKASSVRASSAQKAVHSACRTIGVRKDFLKAGPSVKLSILKEASLPKRKVDTFLKAASQLNALSSSSGSFKSLGSAIKCYYGFCELKGVPPFPATERLVREWSSLFNSGGTFYNYLNHLRNASFFLHQPTDWWTPAIKSLCKGMNAKAKGKFRFPNFITSDKVLKIIKRETPSGEFGQLAFIAFLFALRVPSEALILRRAFANDELEGFRPMKDSALIGLRGPSSNPSLVLRLATRKNLPLGCIMKRPCFCDIAKCVEHRLCPVHYLWPIIRARVSAGELLFPTYSGRNVNAVLRAVLKKLSISEAERYSSHGFRRGAAQ